MNKFYRLLRYEIPLHFVLLFTNWLPDNVIFIKFRGLLAKPFFKKCGANLGLGRNVCFYNCSKMEIGSNVYIAYGCWLNGDICIEDEVMLGPYCVVAPTNHTKTENESYRFGPNTSGTVTIGFGSWLGTKATIAGNVNVGKGSVIAANSVLTKDCGENSLMGGVPAKQIIKNIE